MMYLSLKNVFHETFNPSGTQTCLPHAIPAMFLLSNTTNHPLPMDLNVDADDVRTAKFAVRTKFDGSSFCGVWCFVHRCTACGP